MSRIEESSNLMLAIYVSVCFSGTLICLSISNPLDSVLLECILIGFAVGPCMFIGLCFFAELAWRIKEGEQDA